MFVLIPARGGSKGIPGKNIKILDKKPLIQYTIDSARKVFDDQKIIVSTDDPKVKTVVESLGLKVPFLRPTNLATDESGMVGVILHAVKYLEAKGENHKEVVILQPTSPLRTNFHIEEAIQLYRNNIDMVASVKEASANPYYVLKEETPDGFLKPSKEGNFVRRQDCPKVWELNGAIYIINIESLKKLENMNFQRTIKYLMDERSSVDIDNEIDWLLAEILLKKSN